MAKLEWDKVGGRFYETGCDRGVLFVMDPVTAKAKTGVAWSGLTAVNESPSGAEATELYADNIKYLNLVSAETFGATIEAYQSPAEFDACEGQSTLDTEKGISVGQQERATFAFTYRTMIGSDLTSEAGYKIHIVYGCTASPTSRDYGTVNDNPEASPLSWEIKTTPVNVPGKKPTATIVIDSRTTKKEVLVAIEKYLYGNESVDSRLLTPEDIIKLIADPNTDLDSNVA